MTYKGQVDGKVGWKVVQSVSWIPDTPPSPDPNRIVVPRAPNWAYALQRLLHRRTSATTEYGLGGSHLASPSGTSFSLKPKLVVSTNGASSCAIRVLITSRNPAIPSVPSEPTDTKVVFTFVAIPTAYWMSKLWERTVNAVGRGG